MKKFVDKRLYNFNFKLSKLHFLYLLNTSLRYVNLSKLKWLTRFKNNKYTKIVNVIKENKKWTNYVEKIKRANKFLVGVRNKTKIKTTDSGFLKLKSFKSFRRYDFSIKRRFGFKRIFIFFRLDEKPIYKRRRNLNFKKNYIFIIVGLDSFMGD